MKNLYHSCQRERMRRSGSAPGGSGSAAIPPRYAFNHIQRNSTSVAKPNYSFQKRQRDLAKKQKKEEKRLRKAGARAPDAAAATPPDDKPAE